MAFYFKAMVCASGIAAIAVMPAAAEAADGRGVAFIEQRHPPTFAISPRTIGITYGAQYFHREAYSGPPKRGAAYHVRRKAS